MSRKPASGHEALTELPLFPLHSTLFPGGVLGLKIVEPRYYQLVKRIVTQGSGLGLVSLVTDSSAPGESRLARVGTYAQMTGFEAPMAQCFLLSVVGKQRFLIEASREDAEGVAMARIRWLPNEPDCALAPEHQALADIVRKLVEQYGDIRFAPPYAYDSASWVSSRLAEVMDMPPTIKQAMLEINDPTVRLRSLAQLMARGKS